MMDMPLPLTRDLVLIGGGHAHALVLRMWAMQPVAGTRVTLINPGPTAPYSGMLPGHIAGHYTREALDIDLVKLARFAGARLILGEANRVDPVAKTVTLAGRGEIGYDVASIDVGIHTEMPGLPGFAEPRSTSASTPKCPAFPASPRMPWGPSRLTPTPGGGAIF